MKPGLQLFGILLGSAGLLATACLALCLPSPARAEAKAIDPLRVMSFNIRYGTADDGPNRWDRRREHVMAMLKQRDPDLIGLQECLDFQLEQIKAALPGHAAYALGREKDGGGEMCAILWRSDRFELIDSGSFGLAPEGKLGETAWDAALPRICSWVHLHDRLNARSFWLYNAHLDHVGEQARLESAKLLLQRIGESFMANGAEMPVLLTGDFNCTPDSAPMQALLSQLQDCHALGNFTYSSSNERLPMDESASGTFHNWTGEAGRRRIDYVLSSPDFSLISSELIRDSWRVGKGRQATLGYLSDHFPLMVELYWD